MKETQIRKTSIIDCNDYAVIGADFSVMQCILQDDYQWASHVLAHAGYSLKDCEWVARLNIIYPSRIIPQNPDNFIALGPIGITERLVYQIQRTGPQKTKVTPMAYIETASKIGTTLFLALLFLVPAFFSPVLWIKIQRRNLVTSKICLSMFCEYLVDYFKNDSE
jgi:hypothetical protein